MEINQSIASIAGIVLVTSASIGSVALIIFYVFENYNRKKIGVSDKGQAIKSNSTVLCIIIFVITMIFVLLYKSKTEASPHWYTNWKFLLPLLVLFSLLYLIHRFWPGVFSKIYSGFGGLIEFWKWAVGLALVGVLVFFLIGWLTPDRVEELPIREGSIHLEKGVKYRYYRGTDMGVSIVTKEKKSAILIFQKERDRDVSWKQSFDTPGVVERFEINDDESSGVYIVRASEDLDAFMEISK